jgi:hypothetical protein
MCAQDAAAHGVLAQTCLCVAAGQFGGMFLRPKGLAFAANRLNRNADHQQKWWWACIGLTWAVAFAVLFYCSVAHCKLCATLQVDPCIWVARS